MANRMSFQYKYRELRGLFVEFVRLVRFVFKGERERERAKVKVSYLDSRIPTISKMINSNIEQDRENVNENISCTMV